MIDDIISASSSSTNLEKFILKHHEEIQDYFRWTTDHDLEGRRRVIQDYVTSKRNILLQLNPTGENLSFLALLLDTSERLGLIHGFRYLFTHLKSNNFNIGSRLEAASLYLLESKSADSLIAAYEPIYDLLKESYLNEEDNSDKVFTTIVNYYSKAILDFGDFNIGVAKEIGSKMSNTIRKDEYSVLSHPLIHDILQTDLSDFEVAHTHIRSLLDQYLRRGHNKGTLKDGFIIEQGTIYSSDLATTEKNFMKIRSLSVEKHQRSGNQGIFNSLHRGVSILQNEPQLFAYMHGFGKMHRGKLISAFNELSEDFFNKKLNIIDWGCGQAMGTMCFLDHCSTRTIKVETILLIEPSTIALERGALHVKKYIDSNLVTVNKELDDLTISDVQLGTGVNLHLFSNIIDIEEFSLVKLTQLIKSGFAGKNYFIVVSPYVDDKKKERLNTFVRSFSGLKDFNLISEINQKSGEWEDTWTRISRVFSVELNFKT